MSEVDVQKQSPSFKAVSDLGAQFLLLMIALGFGNAFMLLVRPLEDLTPRVKIVVPVSSFVTTHGVDLAVFLIYLAIGLRYLWTNWLYLSVSYADNKTPPSRPEVVIDILRILLSGIVIGLQSSYASGATLHAFFYIFNIFLFINSFFPLVSAIASVLFSSRSTSKGRKTDSGSWIVTNLLWFGLGLAALPDFHAPHPSLVTYLWPILFAAASSVTSILITWNMYFSASRWLDLSAMRLVNGLHFSASAASSAVAGLWKSGRRGRAA